MNMQDIERKIRLMREMQRMAEEAQAEADSLKDEIKAYMGASETLSVGEYKITYKTVKGSRLDGTALKKAMPDIYSCLLYTFCRPTETRHFCVA